mmetsp:Transcript_71625/g.231815  ORF Transcript_71625/g.231815 Transcript_71625/m.231815 type:complete len:231 (+) Transcript_71625:340-1032(+)
MRHLSGAVQTAGHRQAAVRREEGGEVVGAVACHADALGLQILQSLGQVQNALRARAHDAHRRATQLGEVCRYIPRLLGTPVHSANPTRHEQLDAGQMSDHHRCRHRRCTILPRRHDCGQIPARHLLASQAQFAKSFQLLRAHANVDHSIENANCGRRHATFPEQVLNLLSCLHVLGVRHSMGNDGRFQSHQRAANAQRFCNLGGVRQWQKSGHDEPLLAGLAPKNRGGEC